MFQSVTQPPCKQAHHGCCEKKLKRPCGKQHHCSPSRAFKLRLCPMIGHFSLVLASNETMGMEVGRVLLQADSKELSCVCRLLLPVLIKSSCHSSKMNIVFSRAGYSVLHQHAMDQHTAKEQNTNRTAEPTRLQASHLFRPPPSRDSPVCYFQAYNSSSLLETPCHVNILCNDSPLGNA